MPIYNAKIEFSFQVTMPVHADSKEEALNYLNNPNDWKSEAAYDLVIHDDALVKIRAVDELNSPEDSVVAGDSLPWGPGECDDSISSVFYEDQLKAYKPSDDDSPEWEPYIDKEVELLQAFEEKRQGQDQL